MAFMSYTQIVKQFNYELHASFNTLPALKAGTFAADIWISAPV
jgi:hypothetical protein